MDEATYTAMLAWMLACQSDEDQADMIREQFLSGRISQAQAIGALVLFVRTKAI
jgi:hypothetical protein